MRFRRSVYITAHPITEASPLVKAGVANPGDWWLPEPEQVVTREQLLEQYHPSDDEARDYVARTEPDSDDSED